MKDYYQIMGIGRSATEVEIKRSYRKLAILYHPDKNPSKEAENFFKEINEAYEVLSDPERRFRYDQMWQHPRATLDWQQATAYARPTRATRPSDRMVFMQAMLGYARLLFYFGCLWSLVLAVDFVLPSRVREEKVVSDMREVTKILMRDHGDLLVTEQGHHFPVLMSELAYFPKESNLRIHTSSIFSAVIKVENYNGSYEVNNLGTIYRNFSFAPILLLVCCVAGVAIRKGIEFHVNLGIVVFLLVILNIVFLYKSIL